MAQYAETALDKRQRERVQQSQQQRAAVSVNGTPPVEPQPQPQARKSDRWATYNAFVDVIAPRLTLAERAVWHVMFRHARNGVVETSVRMLTGGAAISQSTAQLAIGRLQEAGLVWPIWKSKDKGKASKYAMHPSPADCLAKLL